MRPAFSKLGLLKKGLLFGLILWMLSGVLPTLPLYFLYNIGFRLSDLWSALVSSFFLSEIMGIGFVAVYEAIARDKTSQEYKT